MISRYAFMIIITLLVALIWAIMNEIQKDVARMGQDVQWLIEKWRPTQ